MTSWIGTMMDTLPAKKKDEKDKPVGTHGGRLTPEARETRRAKNARTASRGGQATRPRGSSKRPFKKGTATQRGTRR